MADFEVRFLSSGSGKLEKEIQRLGDLLDKTQQQIGKLAQVFGDSSDSSQELATNVHKAANATQEAGKSVDSFAESVSDAGAFVQQFESKVFDTNAPLLSLSENLQESANEALQLRDDLSKVGDNTESLKTVSDAVGKSSVALETLSNKLNTTNEETRKILGSTLDFADQVDELAQASGRSSEEISGFFTALNEGNQATTTLAQKLNTTEEIASKLAQELGDDAELLKGLAERSGMTADELEQLVKSINNGNQSLGELIDVVAQSDGKLSDFIQSFDKAEASIKNIADATQLGEDKVRQFVNEISKGDKSVSELARAMNVSEDEVLALVKSYVDLQYKSSTLEQSTKSLASSYNVVKQSLSPIKKAIENVDDAMKGAVKNIDDLGNGSEDAFENLEDSFGLIEEKAQELLDVLVEFGSNAVSAFAEFDGALRQTAVIGGLTEGDVRRLTKTVIQLGVETSASPAQIAEMTAALSRAGFTADEQIVSLEGMIRVSEATGEEFSVLSNVIGNTVRTFGLAASEADTIGDVLVAAANSTNTSISDLGEGLAYVGTQAVQSNQSVSEIAITLGLLADNGLEGSVGGTALAEALRRLSLASAGANSEFTNLIRGNEKMVGAFRSLEADIRDANGQLLPLTQILPLINDRLNAIGKQEDREIIANALFGVQGARGFLSVMGQVDDRLQVVSAAVKNSGGTAKAAGAEILDGISGTLDIFASTVDTFSIKLGEFLSVGVEPVVQGATNLINSFLALPAPIQQVIFGVTSLSAALSAAVVVMTIYNTTQIKATIAALADAYAKTKLAIANFSLTGSITSLNLALGASVKSLYGSAAASGAAATGVAGFTLSLKGLGALLTGVLKLFGSLAKTAVLAAKLILPLLAVAASIKLITSTFDNITKSSEYANESIEDITKSFNEYAESVGLATINTEEIGKEMGTLGQIIKSIEDVLKNFTDFLYNVDPSDVLPEWLIKLIELIPGVEEVMSGAEAEMTRLMSTAGSFNIVLNNLTQSFVNFKVQGKLGSDAAQGLVVQIQKAKDAISEMQAAAIENGTASEGQLLIWQQQQTELSRMLDALNAAKIETDKLNQAQLESVEVNQQLIDNYNKLADALDSALGQVESSLTDRLIAANQEFANDTEKRNAAIADIEATALVERLAVYEKFITDRKALTGLPAEQEQENQQTILELEQEYAKLRLEQVEKEAQRREEIEEAAAEKQEAIAKRAFDTVKILLDEQTNEYERAVNDRIALENAAIEAINDQTDALSQQLELVKLIGEQEDILANQRLASLERSIAGDEKRLELIRTIRDTNSSDEQIQNAITEAKARGIDLSASEASILDSILAKREESRRVELAQLVTRQQREQEELAYQQELARLDLDRQVRQAQINALEAEQNVIKAEQAVKSQMIELSEQKRLLIQAQLNGASEAEIQNLAAQIDLLNSQIELGMESVKLARDAVELSNAEVTDAEGLREGYTQIAEKQTENLKLKQAAEKQDAEAAAQQKREDDRTEKALSRNRAAPPAPEPAPPPPEPERFRRSGQTPLQQWLGLTGRADGGTVAANTPYVVGERGPELFLPNTSGNILPNNLLGNLALDRPGTFVPNPLVGMNIDSLAAEIKGLRKDLANRPVPAINAPTTFVNEPNPLAAQMAMLQNQLKAARSL